MAEYWNEVWAWLLIERNRAILTVLTPALVLGFGIIGGFFWYFKRQKITVEHKFPPDALPGFQDRQQVSYDADMPPTPVGHITLTLDDYETRLRKRETELREDLAAAHAGEKAQLQAQIDELTTRRANPEAAFAAFKTRIEELETQLGNAASQLEQDARDALDAGDLDRAEDLFAQIQHAQDMAIKKAADAAFARGRIAEEQIRWSDALTHYADAARLSPNFKTLHNHWKLLWKLGEYQAALPIADQLETAAISEFGTDSEQHATALNCRAVIFSFIGQFNEAEPLYRQAMQITKDALGQAHPNYARDLNNLAALLHATGRHNEAEPLYRQAMQITKDALGQAHPDYATRLNNLAELLHATGRLDEAEPLYRQDLQITKDAQGEKHPNYASGLNNLAGLLRDTGRLEEAEALIRQATQITKGALGEDNPTYATKLNNLAALLHDTERLNEAEPLYRQAIDILEATTPDHPNTTAARANLDTLLAQMGKT